MLRVISIQKELYILVIQLKMDAEVVSTTKSQINHPWESAAKIYFKLVAILSSK